MERLRYETPMMREECFAANEYVAACWQVACNVRGADTHASNQGRQGVTHREEHCGTAANQVIHKNGSGYTMIEENVENQPDLPCTITTPNWEQATALNHDPIHGETIYWTTTGKMGQTPVTWYHRGTVENASNHS